MDHVESSHAVTAPAAQYTSERGGRRSRKALDAERASRNRLRALYFGLASLWGFLVGALGMALAVREDALAGSWVPALLAVALTLTLTGSGVIAGVYRGAQRRSGSGS
jgi:hypothetical protein